MSKGQEIKTAVLTSWTGWQKFPWLLGLCCPNPNRSPQRLISTWIIGFVVTHNEFQYWRQKFPRIHQSWYHALDPLRDDNAGITFRSQESKALVTFSTLRMTKTRCFLNLACPALMVTTKIHFTVDQKSCRISEHVSTQMYSTTSLA